tara:strand:- start:3317 stop:7981 length:4665 start_codon:yes stop_codon:yes gene_type:complete
MLMLILLGMTFPAYAWKMEAGKLTLSSTSSLSQLQTHTFQQTYDTPPIVIALPSSAGSDPSTIRISNITTTSFRMSPVEPSSNDGPHAAMTVSYIAIEAGSHTFPDGEVIEAGILSTDKMQFNGNPNGRKDWETLSFLNTFSSPILLADIQTIANEVNTIPRQPSHPWMTVAIDSITNTQATISLERSEVYDRQTGPNYQFDALGNTEDIGYVIMSRGLIGNFLADSNQRVYFETLYSANSVDGWDDGCDSINFTGTYSSTPIVVATKSTRNEIDGGWLRECSVNSSRIQLTVDEDKSQDSERSHSNENASLLIISSSFFYDSTPLTPISTSNTLMFESKIASLVPNAFTTINFDQIYEIPPAVFILEDNQNPEPSSVRIRNITEQSFEVVPVEPDSRVTDASDQNTTIQYLAISKGEFLLPDGKAIEIGPTLPPNEITNFQAKRLAGDSWFSFNFATTFSSTPALLSQIQTMNNEPTHTVGSASQPWMTTAVRNVTTNGGDIALDRAETNTGTLSVAEEIAFLATESGIIGDFKDVSGTNISSEAQVTPDSIAGTRSCYNYNFLQSYPSPPLVIGSQMTWDGGDGGWLRRCSTTNSSVSLKIEEDWASDTDNAHTTERAGFLAFSEPFYADLSLVANYQLEGPSWNSTPGEVIDSSNSGLHGQAYGDARAQSAKVCLGAAFDGSGDYIQITHDPILNISDELTVMAWVNPTSLPSSDLMTIVSKDTNFEFHLDTAGRVLWWWENSSAASHSFTSNALTVSVGNWHHVAITYSKSAGTQKIYIDGVEGDSRTFANESLMNNSLPLLIGTDYAYPSRDFNGSIDEVKVFKRSLPANAIQKYAAKTRPCVSCLLNRFDISQPTYTLACPDTRAEVSITARCADGSVKTDYTGSADLSGPSGSSFFDASIAGNSISTLSYGIADLGARKAYLYFDNENNDVRVTATDTSAAVTSSAVTGTDFRSLGFNITTPPTSFACGNNTTMNLVAYGQTDKDPGGSCEIITGFSGTKTLDTWFRATLDDDASPDLVSQSLTVAGTAISAQDNTANNNLTLDFTNGESSFDLAYPNAAKIIDLNFRLDSPPYDGSVFSEMAASTNTFVVRPERFLITAQSSGTDIDGSSNSDTTIHKAGQVFDLELTAQCSDGAGTYTTTSDYAPNNSTNTVMTYLQRTGPLGGSSINGDMPVSASKILTSDPSTSITWESANFSPGDFSNGIYNYAGASYSEVGLTRLFFKDMSYFAEEIPQSFVNIGRFIPDHFNVLVSAGSLQPFCSIGAAPDFSYTGQTINYTTPPSLTIQARNTNNIITQNYTESNYLKLIPNDIRRFFPTEDITNFGTDGSTKLAITATTAIPSAFSSATNGSVVYSFLNTDSFEYTRNVNSLVAPFNSDLKVVITDIFDSDVVESNAEPYDVLPSAIELRYGRWVMDSAYGPETQNLAIPMKIESWNGTTFSKNTSDNCSTYDSADLIDIESLTGGSTTPSGNGTLISGVAPLGSQISLSAPLENNIGTVNLEFQVDSWLRYDWDNNPVTADTNPSSVASFGQFRGHDRIIYWREISN